MTAGLGKTRYLKITNISDQKLALQADTRIGMWLGGGRVPRTPGFVLVGSRRYAEWQNVAFQATTDQVSEEELHAEPDEPLVDRPLYETPLKILRRDTEDAKPIVALVPMAYPDEAKPEPISELVGRAGGSDCPIASDSVSEASEDVHEVRPDHEEAASQLNTPPIATQDDAGDEEVCYRKGGDLFAEDVEKEMAVLPEAKATMDEVTIENIQVGDPAENTPKEIERLRQIIWKRRHFLMVNGTALLPAAVSAVCDIDFAVGKDDHSIHISVGVPERDHHQENGVDIRLFIDYRLVNSLTRLMVYPMSMINDLLEDLDRCSDIALSIWPVASGWLIDNALYGHLRISADRDRSKPVDVFETGEPEPNPKPSVLGRRSYIDDILVMATTWDSMGEKVKRLLDTCERWNLSINVVESFWANGKVGYLGHRYQLKAWKPTPRTSRRSVISRSR
ncbi:unnamed protein product [Phytophthora fragariaefolia]|uniref:Unnamed protein product n=1 Tax=Phytophthora fragariaefolia TaxID=1490495 RepID=A0A9W7CWQ8_9STRA|nr:unnamed protein product [Phytophthora fragariaefolia]